MQTSKHGSTPPAGDRLGRRELYAWTLCVIGLAYWADGLPALRGPGATILDDLTQSVLGRGAFCAGAWIMLASFVPRLHAAAASRRDIAAAVAICLLGALPTRQASVLALILLGVLITRQPAGRQPAGRRTAGRRTAGPAERSAAVILFGLALDLAWTSTYALPLHVATARFDAGCVTTLLGLLGMSAVAHGNIVTDPLSGWSIEILSPCASSFPLAGVALAFVVTKLYQGRAPGPADLPWLAGSLAASVGLSEIRLAWMAARPDDYTWMHVGGGVTLYTMVALALAIMFPVLATRARMVRALA